MKCLRCQYENPTGTKFCGECAAPLASTCPSCGATTTPESKFCGQCATPLPAAPPTKFAAPDSYTPKHLAEMILTSKAALEGERKQITVLFADLKGSMELLADRDPEEAQKILDPVLERMMEAVHRYEGTVNQVMGDGIMALFGAPVAHEDHAVRGCYAALRMQELVRQYAEDVSGVGGVPIQIRVGLNSGEVVVRSIGSDLHMDYTAVGQTTHLAARMEQLATPGSILLTADTLRVANRFFEASPVGATLIKGLSQPVEVFQLIGVGTRARSQVVASRLTRFIGRHIELAVLGQALDKAHVDHGQVVGVRGEPGIGKTRLFYEFTHSAHTQGWHVLETSAVSYGRTTAYLPVIDLLKVHFQIEERDDRRTIRQKVTSQLLSLDANLQQTLPALFALLDVPVEDEQWQALDPPQRRQRTLDALTRLVLGLSHARPLCLVVENLHWIDSETQAWLDSVVDSLPAARLLLLVNYRPEYQHGWEGKIHYTHLRLDRLPPGDAEELFQALVRDAPALEPLRQSLIDHTEGNPFFLEESVRALVERKVPGDDSGTYRLARPVPATVQAVLAARIDRLPDDDKRLLQAASVIGKNLPFSLLQATAELPENALRRHLARLQAAEFLYQTSLFPDLEYTFTHALTHEVAYGSILQERRRYLHARILEAIERLYPDRLAEHVERLAHHAVRGEVWDRAVDYLRKAGTKAYARGALSDSRERYQQALDLLTRLPSTPEYIRRGIDVRLELHAPLVGLGDLPRTVELHQEAGELARQLEDRPRLGRIASRMANLAWLDARYPSAIELAQEALRIAAAIDDPDVRAEATDVRINATQVLGLTYLSLGQYHTSIELLRQNVEGPVAPVARQSSGFTIPPYVFGCGLLAWGSALLGDFETALTYGRRGVDEAEVSGSFHAQAAACLYLAIALVSRGEFEAALPLCERGLRLSETGAISFWRAFGYSMWGWALACSGDPDQGLPYLEQGALLQEGVGIKAIRSVFWTRWGEGLLLNGDILKARSAAVRALELAVASGERGFEAEAHCLLARTAAEGRAPEVEAAGLHYERASALAAELDMGPLVARCHLGLGTVYRRTGNRQQVKNHLTTATMMFREMDMRFWLERAETETKMLR